MSSDRTAVPQSAAVPADPVRTADPCGERSTTRSDPGAAALSASAEPLARVTPSAEFLSRIPREYARRHLLVSSGSEDGTGDQSAREPLLIGPQTRASAVHNAAVALGRPVTTRAAPAEFIAGAIDSAYAKATPRGGGGGAGDETGVPVSRVEGSADVERDLAQAVRDAETDLLNTRSKVPTVRLVDLILFEALSRGASDVHVQPQRDETLVRYRLDGALHTVRRLPVALASAVTSRIKVMARLDVAEQRAAQDGRAGVTIGGPARQAGLHHGRRIDLRVSTIPSTYGERVVVRLLDPANSPHLRSFAALGMPREMERTYLMQAARACGIVLSTGPTGSGKTTTLYATLAWISSTNAGGLSRGCELNIMTVEDPVEYDLAAPGLAVSQTQVDPRKNVTFATGLRHILRQDPDVIMVGEVRDEETARMAVQASLTGHLVLSTLHTNDAPSAVARLLDLDVEPFLVCSSLSAVLAQRLVRMTHTPCAGKGCDGCLSTGYKGRTGVFELLVLDPGLRELVGRRCSSVELKEAAERKGMASLRREGMRLVSQGLTTAAEVARVIEAVDEPEAAS